MQFSIWSDGRAAACSPAEDVVADISRPCRALATAAPAGCKRIGSGRHVASSRVGFERSEWPDSDVGARPRQVAGADAAFSAHLPVRKGLSKPSAKRSSERAADSRVRRPSGCNGCAWVHQSTAGLSGSAAVCSAQLAGTPAWSGGSRWAGCLTLGGWSGIRRTRAGRPSWL